MPAPLGRALYEAGELIGMFGVRVNEERRCSCCGKFNLYAIQYDKGIVVLLCSRCDQRA